MFNNYFKTALRNLFKQKSFTFINIVGFAVGMTCFILILIYVLYETSYDKFFPDSDRIYRLAIERKYPDKIRNWGRTAFPVAATFKEEFPEILLGTRLINNNISLLVTYQDKHIYNERVMFADANFFEVFKVPFIEGDPQAALARPNCVVLTETTAEVVFGDEPAMSKTLNINNLDYTVTGITQDIPHNSHFHYDYLLSTLTIPAFRGQQWINAWGAFTYFLVQEGTDARILESKFPEMVTKYMAPEVVDEVGTSFEDFVAGGNGYRYFLQRLTDIHLTSHLDQEIEPNGSITYVYLFSVISVFVLLIACINFMNLSTARSSNRAREVGIRKTVGSSRRQIVFQFLFESILMSLVSLVIAVLLVELLLPVFNSLTGRELDIQYFNNAYVLPGLILYILLVGILAGSYPAFFLSSFRPVRVLKGNLQRGTLNNRLRNGLVVFQFAISIVLIVSTLVVNSQINYMLNKDLGFDKEYVVVIRNAIVLGDQVEAFKQSLLALPSVLSTSGSLNFPGGAFDGNVHRPVGTTDDQATSISMIVADYDYVQTMGMELIAGRNLSREFGNERNSYVLNEKAVRMLGLEKPVDARITDHNRIYTVVGVLKDFHFKSLHNEISPLAYALGPPSRAGFVSVRVAPQNLSKTVSSLEKVWHEFSGERPFEFTFLDEDLMIQYEAEQKTKQLSGIFSAIAVFIGCLGLFGLAAFTAEKRTKEIGIRKVLGASIPKITFLLVKDFTRLVGIAFVIATPIAYFAMHDWLQKFAYYIDMSVLPFVLAGLAALGIALLTVGYQAFKAAFRDPVDSLRYE
jgi:putative ABC transport system permease protein